MTCLGFALQYVSDLKKKKKEKGDENKCGKFWLLMTPAGRVHITILSLLAFFIIKEQ